MKNADTIPVNIDTAIFLLAIASIYSATRGNDLSVKGSLFELKKGRGKPKKQAPMIEQMTDEFHSVKQIDQ